MIHFMITEQEFHDKYEKRQPHKALTLLLPANNLCSIYSENTYLIAKQQNNPLSY